MEVPSESFHRFRARPYFLSLVKDDRRIPDKMWTLTACRAFSQGLFLLFLIPFSEEPKEYFYQTRNGGSLIFSASLFEPPFTPFPTVCPAFFSFKSFPVAGQTLTSFGRSHSWLVFFWTGRWHLLFRFFFRARARERDPGVGG